VYEWVNVREYCKALWIKALYKCNPLKDHRASLTIAASQVMVVMEELL